MEPLIPIPLRQIDADPRFQVRLQWDPKTDPTLATLAASLAGPEGLIHPVVVVRLAEPTTFGRHYALIAGHRRLAAARQLGWATILARVLPPCDLTQPQAQLPLLAMAVRENTEREALAPADRQAALRRLHALYMAVHPEAASPRSGGNPPAAPEPFVRWATRVTTLPAHTIRRALRGRLFTAGLDPGTPAPSAPDAPATDPPAVPPDPVQATLQATRQAATTLQALATTWPRTPHPPLPAPQVEALHQQLATLQTTLASCWPLLHRPAAHPLVPFALAAQEQLAALRGTLWGLKTGAPEAWQTLPPPVLRALHTAMAAVLADWEAVAAARPEGTPLPRTPALKEAP